MASWRRRHSSFSLNVAGQSKALQVCRYLHGALDIRVNWLGSINWTLSAPTREHCRLEEDAVDSPFLGEKIFGRSSSVDSIKMAIVSEERCRCMQEGIDCSRQAENNGVVFTRYSMRIAVDSRNRKPVALFIRKRSN